MKNIYEIEGVEFPSRTAAARHYGLNPKLVNERVTKFGWTLEQALELETRPKGDYRKKVVIDGTEYSSMRQAARECSGQLKLATVLEFSQYSRSDSLGVRPPLY